MLIYMYPLVLNQFLILIHMLTCRQLLVQLHFMNIGWMSGASTVTITDSHKPHVFHRSFWCRRLPHFQPDLFRHTVTSYDVSEVIQEGREGEDERPQRSADLSKSTCQFGRRTLPVPRAHRVFPETVGRKLNARDATDRFLASVTCRYVR